MNFNNLLSLANRAKSLGEYRISNAIFALLLNALLEKRSSDLVLRLETRDEKGESMKEAYYDLLLIEEVDTGNSLCIPLPLLTTEAVISACKAGVHSVERKEHHRAIVSDNGSMKNDLMKEFQEIVRIYGKDMKESVLYVLTYRDGDGELFKTSLYDWIKELENTHVSVAC